jgi:porphobilinogen synthase
MYDLRSMIYFSLLDFAVLFVAVKIAVEVPVSVYNISGEYAMIKAAAKMGWVNEEKAILETLTSFKRAGADLIATYFGKDAVRLLG